MGLKPDFLFTIREAKWLGVAPWEYIGVPESAGHECWMIWTRFAQALEAHIPIAQQAIAARKPKS